MSLKLFIKSIYHQYQNKWIAFYSLGLAKMEKIEINGKLFQINFFSGNQIYIVSVWDGEEFRVPFMRSHFKTKKGALKRCQELAE